VVYTDIIFVLNVRNCNNRTFEAIGDYRFASRYTRNLEIMGHVLVVVRQGAGLVLFKIKAPAVTGV
jgi:hypothetical protein